MAPIDDDTLDRLLTRHVSLRLDGQVGRAAAAFRHRLSVDPAFAAGEVDANEAAPLPAMRLVHGDAPPPAGLRPPARPRRPVRVIQPPPPVPGRLWGRDGGWLVSVAGTAVAASLATLLVLPRISPTVPADRGQRVVEDKPPAGAAWDRPLARYVQNQALDEGTVAPDGTGTPVRRVRVQQFEHLHWYDPQRNARIEMVVPRQDVRQYELDTY